MVDQIESVSTAKQSWLRGLCRSYNCLFRFAVVVLANRLQSGNRKPMQVCQQGL